jgi:hypothetical protein
MAWLHLDPQLQPICTELAKLGVSDKLFRAEL